MKQFSLDLWFRPYTLALRHRDRLQIREGKGKEGRGDWGRVGGVRVIINGISNGELILKEIKARKGRRRRHQQDVLVTFEQIWNVLKALYTCTTLLGWVTCKNIYNSSILWNRHLPCNCHGVEDFSANRQNALSNFYLANDDVFSCNFITLVKDEFRSRSAADAAN